MKKDSLIFIAGHKGLVGSALVKLLQKEGFENLLLKPHAELDLCDQAATESFFATHKPEFVFFCAAKVGGMLAQLDLKADFLYQNLQMQSNVLHFAYKYGVKKLVFLASFCVYPEFSELPIKERYMLSGYLQPNNEPYGIAKIAGIKSCEYYNAQYKTHFIALAPVSVYGANDNFNLKSSHVQAAIFRKIYLAKLLAENKKELLMADLGAKSYEEALNFMQKHKLFKDHIQMLGTGAPKREFLHCDDLARAAFFVMQNVSFKEACEFDARGKCLSSHLNVGNGVLVSIKELAYAIKDIVGYKGELIFEQSSKQDGTVEKLADLSKLNKLGFRAEISLQAGLKAMYEDYALKNQALALALANGGGVMLPYLYLALKFTAFCLACRFTSRQIQIIVLSFIISLKFTQIHKLSLNLNTVFCFFLFLKTQINSRPYTILHLQKISKALANLQLKGLANEKRR